MRNAKTANTNLQQAKNSEEVNLNNFRYGRWLDDETAGQVNYRLSQIKSLYEMIDYEKGLPSYHYDRSIHKRCIREIEDLRKMIDVKIAEFDAKEWPNFNDHRKSGVSEPENDLSSVKEPSGENPSDKFEEQENATPEWLKTVERIDQFRKENGSVAERIEKIEKMVAEKKNAEPDHDPIADLLFGLNNQKMPSTDRPTFIWEVESPIYHRCTIADRCAMLTVKKDTFGKWKYIVWINNEVVAAGFENSLYLAREMAEAIFTNPKI